jgi:hypothetical protein
MTAYLLTDRALVTDGGHFVVIDLQLNIERSLPLTMLVAVGDSG